MKFQLFAILAMVVFALAQGVTDKIAPPGSSPDGCSPSTDGEFEIAILPLKHQAKRAPSLQNRAVCSSDGTLVVRLADGVLTDNLNRTAYIASNFQFQFDDPPQAGALYTAGFSSCANGSLALGDTAVFWQCASGTFFNLYDRWWALQCEPVLILVVPCGDGSSGGAGGGGDGGSPGETVIGSEVVTATVVVPLPDGQPQVVTTTSIVYICQIGDGQIQGHTTPCAGPPTPAVSIPPASQFSDGQVQVTPGPPVPSASPPGGQVTLGPGPVAVPTDAPPVNSAGGGARGRVEVAVAVGLGLVGIVWF